MGLRPPHSLRARLLWLLLAAILVTTCVQALFAYRTARAEADSIFDYHMQQMAMALRSGLPTQAAAGVDVAPGDSDDLDFVVQVWTSNGLRVFESAARASLPQRAVLGFTDVKARGTTYRVFSMQSRSQVIQVAQDMAARRAMARSLAIRTIAPIAVLGPLLMFVAWWVVSRSLAPVSRVRRQVASRQPDDLSEVSETGLPDEIGPLVHELNLLFARVRKAFESQKTFVADAAHELRTPLAALKLQARGLQRAGDDASRDLAVTRLHSGIDRATRLVEQMLSLARYENSADSRVEPVSLGAVLRRAANDTLASRPELPVQFELGHCDEGRVEGRAEALDSLVRNLLDNAIKYTPAGGRVLASIRREPAGLVLRVEDSGPGIEPEERERVLDRFYRIPGNGATGGGLGLAIVRSIADQHGADLVLGRSERLGGLMVSVAFPAID